MKFGYARISTPKQSLENQVALLKQAGCEQVFSDVITGYNSRKLQFEKLMQFMRAGDVVVVTGIDRLGRSTRELSALIEEFHEKDFNLHVLGYDIDTRTSQGKMFFDMMAVIAENERNRIVERIRQGIAGAKARGRKVGRPKKLSPEKAEKMVSFYKAQTLSIQELSLMYGISKVSVYAYVKDHGMILNTEDKRRLKESKECS